MPRQDLIQYRRGTAATWSYANPVLAAGEVGYASDTNDLRVGDGVEAWADLPSIGVEGLPDWLTEQAFEDKANLVEGTVPESELPEWLSEHKLSQKANLQYGVLRDTEVPNYLREDELENRFVQFGYQDGPIPQPIRPVQGLLSAPPGTTQQGPIEVTTIYNVTDADPTQLVGLGVQSHVIYGGNDYGAVPAKGISHAGTTLFDVQNSADDMNEHSATMGWMRYAAGAKGRAWYTDWSLHGPIGTRPGLLNGVTMLVNNYYNGSPIYGASSGQWIVTKPTAGAGGEAGHTNAMTYKTDVGLGIVGFGGRTTAKTRGFETGLQIGGYGSGWMQSAETSIIGTGIKISDTEVRAIDIVPTGVGGEIRWGATAAIRPISTDGLQIMTGNTSAHKLGFYGKAPVARAAAIASPAADVTALKTAVDAIRVALTNLGLTA